MPPRKSAGSRCPGSNTDIPEYIVWDDGRRYGIEKISHAVGMRRLSSTGGAGIRYTCQLSAKNYIVFGGKQVVCRMPQNISGRVSHKVKAREFYLLQNALTFYRGCQHA